MNRFSKITLLSICSSIIAMPAIANDDTTAVMQELFEIYAVTPEVGSVDDASRSSRWNDVKIMGADGATVFHLPWVEVSQNLLAGYTITMADQMTVSGDLPDGEQMSGTFGTENFEIAVSGGEGARTFDMTFDQMSGDMRAGDEFEMKMVFGAGQAKSTLANEIVTGAFDYPKLDLQYNLNVEDQNSDVEMNMTGMTGKFRSPVIGGVAFADYQKLWDASESYFADYVIPQMNMNMNMASPAGPVSVSATMGASTGRLASTEGVVSMTGNATDIQYNVSAMGMPPMKVTLDESVTNFAVPLDNVDAVKPAALKMGLTGLELDPMIWAMFDPQGLLPKEKANLDIDISAGMKWVQKMDSFDPMQMATGLPVQFEDVKINALNLNAMGADLKTDGAFSIDTSNFPPAASGAANVSIKGVNDLMGKLTTAGLLPVQYSMMAKGMMGVYFKQGGEGVDHLTSQIMIAPNGAITANGLPLK